MMAVYPYPLECIKLMDGFEYEEDDAVANWKWRHQLENIMDEWRGLASRKQHGNGAPLDEDEEKREAYLRKVIMLFV